MSDLDPAGFGAAMMAAVADRARHPVANASVGLAAGTTLARIGVTALGRSFGLPSTPVLDREPREQRFADPAWTDNPAFYATEQAYLLLRRTVTELIGAAEVDEVTRRKASFAAALVLDALAPTNFLLTNPAALKRAFDTGGRSVTAAAANVVRDVLFNGGRPTQVDTSRFSVGENLAATPGVVVFRNHLVEVIQYLPQTKQVHEVPLLVSPPWINKYYVLDLAPERSLVEWAVRHGRTVFVISYRNPDESLRDATLDGYLVDGVHAALDVVAEVTGAETVDLVGLCVGGLLASLAKANHARTGDPRIGTLTLLNTMLDFSEPGDLGCFTDSATVDRLEQRMRRRGYLEGEDMAGTFDVLRANDLIFSYVASSWLKGEPAPALDILAWNAEPTRMPQTMHVEYLRRFYGANDFVEGRLDVAGRRLTPADIDGDVYVVAAENDHIVPWRSSYKTTGLVSADVRFVLSSGGHIAGVVNPPSPKAWFVTSPDHVADPDVWRQSAVRRAGSWWEDWTAWSASRAGALVDPPRLGSQAHPILGEAPGEYVRR